MNINGKRCDLQLFDSSGSAITNILAELRDKDIQTDRHRFRQNIHLLGQLMAYEVSKDLPHTKKEVQTVLGTKETYILDEYPVILNILRAANPFVEGVLEIFPQSDVSFIGAARDEKTLEVELRYFACQSFEDRILYVPDVMLATGSSMISALEYAMSIYGKPKRLIIQAAIASKKGLTDMFEAYPDASFFIGSLDEKLNEHNYIVPGLGDAGDLCYGGKFRGR